MGESLFFMEEVKFTPKVLLQISTYMCYRVGGLVEGTRQSLQLKLFVLFVVVLLVFFLVTVLGACVVLVKYVVRSSCLLLFLVFSVISVIVVVLLLCHGI